MTMFGLAAVAGESRLGLRVREPAHARATTGGRPAGRDPGVLEGSGQAADEVGACPFEVFINYRHEDTPSPAWPLYIKLVERLGSESVFFDRGTLRPGMKWFEEIKPHVARASAFIALIGSKWMELMVTHMQRGDEDYLTREIDLALRSGPRVTVIPVLVDDAELPDHARLPPAIRALPFRQGERLRHTNLLDDIEHLLTVLEQLRGGGLGISAQDLEPANLRSDGGPRSETRLARDLPKRLVPTPRVAPRPDEEHYRMVVQKAGNLVLFVGAGANAAEHEGPWRQGSGALPDDRELAGYLAHEAGLEDAAPDLAQAAQYARTIHGDTDLFQWLEESLSLSESSNPGPLHRYLARLPERLPHVHSAADPDARGLKCFQLIVTPKYDAALERAFRDAGEEFDVAVYMAPGTDGEGWFVHLPWGGEPRTVADPNSYFGFPIDRERRRLTRTVIMRVNGAVDDGLEHFPQDNYVITEDHYIDYLSGRTAAQVVPTQILATLKKANYLFLGYTIADWRLRVFLHRIWEGPKLGGQNYWAVEREPDRLESRLWSHAGVSLYQMSLVEYMQALCDSIDSRRSEPRR